MGKSKINFYMKTSAGCDLLTMLRLFQTVADTRRRQFSFVAKKVSNSLVFIHLKFIRRSFKDLWSRTERQFVSTSLTSLILSKDAAFKDD